MNCQDVLEKLLEYVGGELVIEHRRTVEVHLAGCERCTVLVHTYTHTVRVARALPKCDPLPSAVEARLRQTIEPELSKASKEGKK
jgi:anti-sigma factor RsiW